MELSGVKPVRRVWGLNVSDVGLLKDSVQLQTLLVSNFSAFSLIALEVGKAVVSRIDDCSAAVEPADRTACGDRKLALMTQCRFQSQGK